jgi:uncharacterized protein
LPVIVCCLAICSTVAVAQSFLYYPRVYSAAQVNRMAQSANLQRWTNAIGANIGLKRLSPKQPASGSILIFYGNGSSATGCARYADDIQTVAAMDVYILEYPGYEDRPGPPSEKSIFDAASDGLQMIPTNKPIYLIGASLGSGVASYLAGAFTNRIAGIVLLSPFTSVADVAQYLYPELPVSSLLVDQFPSEDYLRNYHGKVGITVDGKDTIVPEKFGLRLYDGYDGPKKLWRFPNGAHCQISNPQTQFWKEAITFWQAN